MALVLADRVRENTNTAGTGTVTLTGAVTGFASFAEQIGDGNTTYYTITDATSWEVGVGTYSANTLSRDTVLDSSNAGAKINFAIGLKDVFVTLPAEKVATTDTLGTMSTQNANAVAITGGSISGVSGLVTSVTGTAPVVSSGGNTPAISLTTSGANSVVVRDSNQNITANVLDDVYTNVAASGTTITLIASSSRRYTITGSGGQVIKLPDATTLASGAVFQFDNNQSSGAITVNNNSNTLVVSVPSGGFVLVNLLSNATAAGSWDRHDQAPSNVSWSTNTLDYAGSITSATWNGTAVAINRGGTGASTKATAFNALSPMSAAGDVIYGGTSGAGTALAIGTAGQVLTVNSGATAPQWTTPTTGTVTSVGGTGTVNGITLTGTVTSSGNLTLGGTLGSIANSQLTNSSITFGSTAQALGSTVSAISGVTIDNGAIGGTTPAAGTFTTLIGGGGSANYEQITGGATGKAVQFQSLGTDTNISLAIQSKGTGAIDLAAGSSGVNISNGGTVTAITRTVAGSNYTTNPTPSITAPTTAGGVQATATSTIRCEIATVSAGGSGYVVGEILTVVGGTFTAATVLTVATVSGTAVATVNITTNGTYTASPTNPAATTSNLSGTGATFTLNFSVSPAFTITNAGSGYVEQPTVTFSGGGGSGAAAYATVGSGTTIKSIGSTMSFSTSAGESLRLTDGGSGSQASYENLVTTTGTIQYLAAGSNATVQKQYITKGAVNHNFATNTVSTNIQFVVSHTTSAVNYVQVTGATTASKVVAISAQGSDTDVTLSLSPKGAGTIRFGTYTGTILTPTGYITITDSGGTSRRLLVG